MPASAITRLPTSQRNLALQRISHRARRLRGVTQGGVADIAKVGRNDSLEQLTARLGIIPVLWVPNPNAPSSLRTWLQAAPPTRAAGESITLTGPTSPQVFLPRDPARDCQFSTPGADQAVTATSSQDPSATGRGLADVPA
jgi:hypothetical protein